MNKKQEIGLRLLKDPKLYLEKFCKIKTKERGLRSFILKSAQLDLFNTIKNNPRSMFVKARQIGGSTAVAGYFYHNTITNPGTNTALIGYNSDMTMELLDKVKTFLNSTPEEYRPIIKYNSKYEITFPNLESKIIVLPSTDNVGRSYTLHNVLITEFAFWDKAEEKMLAIEACVPKDGRIVIETTPNGIANAFFRKWADKNNGYIKKKYGWWWEYSEEEIQIIKQRIGDPYKFAQEYECAFLSTGRPVFDQASLMKMRSHIKKEGDEITYINEAGETIKDKVRKVGNWMVYIPPIFGKIYVMAADISEGVEGGDYSSAIIFDRETGEEVASYFGHIHPDRLGDELNEYGRKYNNALLSIEVNNHGLTTLQRLKELIYPNMYFRPVKFDSLSQTTSDRMGWRTTTVTKPIMIDDMNKMIRNGEVTFHTEELFDECLTFVYNDDGRPIPSEGMHDDAIMSCGIALQAFKGICAKAPTQINYTKFLPSIGY